MFKVKKLVKNPKLLKIESIVSDKSSKIDFPDIDRSKTFDESIQYIFFRMLTNILSSVEYYLNDEFDTEDFVNSFEGTDYRDFVENLVVTNSFEIFIEDLKKEKSIDSSSFSKLLTKNSQSICYFLTSKTKLS